MAAKNWIKAAYCGLSWSRGDVTSSRVPRMLRFMLRPQMFVMFLQTTKDLPGRITRHLRFYFLASCRLGNLEGRACDASHPARCPSSRDVCVRVTCPASGRSSLTAVFSEAWSRIDDWACGASRGWCLIHRRVISGLEGNKPQHKMFSSLLVFSLNRALFNSAALKKLAHLFAFFEFNYLSEQWFTAEHFSRDVLSWQRKKQLFVFLCTED